MLAWPQAMLLFKIPNEGKQEEGGVIQSFRLPLGCFTVAKSVALGFVTHRLPDHSKEKKREK